MIHKLLYWLVAKFGYVILWMIALTQLLPKFEKKNLTLWNFNIFENNMINVQAATRKVLAYFLFVSSTSNLFALPWTHKTKKYEIHESNPCYHERFFSFKLWYLKIWQKFQNNGGAKLVKFKWKNKKRFHNFPNFFCQQKQKKTIFPKKNASACVFMSHLLHTFLEFGIGVFFYFGLLLWKKELWIYIVEKFRNLEKLFVLLLITTLDPSNLVSIVSSFL
jgi:hypothetical protein